MRGSENSADPSDPFISSHKADAKRREEARKLMEQAMEDVRRQLRKRSNNERVAADLAGTPRYKPQWPI